MIHQILHTIFTAYTVLLAIRIILSWFPNLTGQPWLLFVGKLTDPYLNIFRRLIPPIGGTLDLSPILAFFGLQLIEYGLQMLF